MATDASPVLIEGPWKHSFISANGARFHVAEAGDGPLVVLLHGFPEFWWAWREQLPALADAGYRVAAMDLRGYGASDKPPQGYDTFTLAADVAAVIRSMGESGAVIVGHGWGGWIAWSMPAMQPDVTRAIVSIGMPHPLDMRRASARLPAQIRANRYLWALQRPFLPERAMTTSGLRYVRKLMSSWSGRQSWPPGEVTERYAEALALPFVAHSTAEYYRWVVRSVLRSDGRRFVSRLESPIEVPVLQLHGDSDGCVVPAAAATRPERVIGPYELRMVEKVGHFVPEEAPELTNQLLLDWLAQLPGPPR